MAGTGVLTRMDARRGTSKRAPASDVHPVRWWVRHRLWLLPVLGATVGTVLGVLFVEPPPGMAWLLRGLAWQTTVGEARSMLGTALGIALTSLSIVLSMSMLVVQNAAGQYSPRLLRLFLQSAGIRIVIPVFVATSVYCLVAAHLFGFVQGVERAPRPALSLAQLMLIVCEGSLVYQVLHMLQLMRVESLVRQVREDTLRVARMQAQLRRRDLETPAPLPARTEAGWPLRTRHDGFLAAVDARALLSVATSRGLVVHVDRAIGEPVIRDGEVGWVEPTGPGFSVQREAASDLLLSAIFLDAWRDTDADVALGIRQLVDMAIKALSPGINDPYTAVEAVDQLTFMLCELGRMRLGPRVLADDAGRARVFLHAPALRDYLELATDQILRYGAGEPAVVLRLLRMATAVGQRARHVEDREAAWDTLHRIHATAEHARPDAPRLESLRRYVEGLERAWEGAPLPPLPSIGF